MVLSPAPFAHLSVERRDGGPLLLHAVGVEDDDVLEVTFNMGWRDRLWLAYRLLRGPSHLDTIRVLGES